MSALLWSRSQHHLAHTIKFSCSVENSTLWKMERGRYQFWPGICMIEHFRSSLSSVFWLVTCRKLIYRQQANGKGWGCMPPAFDGSNICLIHFIERHCGMCPGSWQGIFQRKSPMISASCTNYLPRSTLTSCVRYSPACSSSSLHDLWMQSRACTSFWGRRTSPCPFTGEISTQIQAVQYETVFCYCAAGAAHAEPRFRLFRRPCHGNGMQRTFRPRSKDEGTSWIGLWVSKVDLRRASMPRNSSRSTTSKFI